MTPTTNKIRRRISLDKQRRVIVLTVPPVRNLIWSVQSKF